MSRMNVPGRMSGPPGRPQQPLRPAPPACCPMPPLCSAPPASCLGDLPLAMAYVPVQRWGALYSPERALCRGTLFPPLDLPLGGQG